MQVVSVALKERQDGFVRTPGMAVGCMEDGVRETCTVKGVVTDAPGRRERTMFHSFLLERSKTHKEAPVLVQVPKVRQNIQTSGSPEKH